jgi:hypothetical protein
VLVDTSVWIDHLRKGNARLAGHLEGGEVLTHPCVIGEIACGNLSRRDEVLALLRSLPRVTTASDHEVFVFVERHRLAGSGIGWIDAHLLASAALAKARIWSLDARLDRIARRLGLGT